MPSLKMTLTLTGTGLAAGLTLATALPAMAAIGGAHTPGARAAASVNADGSVERSTGVTGVRKIGTGQYCIKLDPDINVTKAVPVATMRWNAPWDSNIYVRSTGCTDQEVFIITGSASKGFSDVAFDVIVD
ncbi:hypothetical protein [Actinomadura rubrisoli]|uniref:Uncharacterized protein n=1 Tax=Actinomadura rubrisoli TaxID=2530368 RepID=A0A4R5A9J3_9ACTN|nr:hypothetical protein [Actinomadura rubrisoli]TDD67796.1 hypothetical protein E1298_39055 [Actinomadura rubrisoli]